MKVFGATFFQKGSKNKKVAKTKTKSTTVNLSTTRWCHKLGTSLKAVIYRASTTGVPAVLDYYSARRRFCKYPKPPIFDPNFRDNVYKQKFLSMFWAKKQIFVAFLPDVGYDGSNPYKKRFGEI